MGSKRVLEGYGLRASKKLGQNFLEDSNILNGIVNTAALSHDDSVIEIGAGLGALTARLCAAAGRVLAYEFDTALKPALENALKDFENVSVIWGDALKADFAGDFGGGCISPSKAAVCANLPYYITTPLIFKLIESRGGISRAVLMVQKEVAERICAEPGGKEYGALTVACGFYAACRIAAIVPPACFYPVPDVESAVLVMDFYDAPIVTTRDEGHMFGVVKAAFATRRKTLVNCLSIAGFDKSKSLEALKQMGLSPDIRGERLSVGEFAALADLL